MHEEHKERRIKTVMSLKRDLEFSEVICTFIWNESLFLQCTV